MIQPTKKVLKIDEWLVAAESAVVLEVESARNSEVTLSSAISSCSVRVQIKPNLSKGAASWRAN